MNESSPLFGQLFLELFESLPRQGPGSRACAARALSLCSGLPHEPKILDLGCGVGGQTLHLAGLTSGIITAVDIHAPSIERLESRVAELGLSKRIIPVAADMTDTGLPPESFDLVWSEGALYSIGIRKALSVCRQLLRPGGYVAFTDAVWTVEDPPPEVRKLFESEYPGMGRFEDLLEIIAASGFAAVGHFTLPDEAWWTDFYTPMEKRIDEMRQLYQGNGEALAVIDILASEPEMHRESSKCYAYEFFVAQRKA